MVLRLQDPEFLTDERNQWWNNMKNSNTYNGYTYTVGPLLPFGSSLKQVFDSTCETLQNIRAKFMNRDDIYKKLVDIEFLQFYSTDNIGDLQKPNHYEDVQDAISKYHSSAAFPIEMHKVGVDLSKNFDFSGEVYKAMLEILKLSEPPNACLNANNAYDVECQAQRYGITWNNVNSQVEHYELEQKIKDNIPSSQNKDDFCELDNNLLSECYWLWLCRFGSSFSHSADRERSIRPFYQATNYTLYNATNFYEAASRDIRDWEQNNTGFYECTAPENHPEDSSGNSVNLTLDFAPEAHGQIREISIYTMEGGQKNFLYCNRSVSGLTMTTYISPTSKFYIRVRFVENQLLYNVTMNHAHLNGAWTVNHDTINSMSGDLSYYVSHTADSVAVDWIMQESACENVSNNEILTVSDFQFLYKTIFPELCQE